MWQSRHAQFRSISSSRLHSVCVYGVRVVADRSTPKEIRSKTDRKTTSFVCILLIVSIASMAHHMRRGDHVVVPVIGSWTAQSPTAFHCFGAGLRWMQLRVPSTKEGDDVRLCSLHAPMPGETADRKNRRNRKKERHSDRRTDRAWQTWTSLLL